MYFSLENKTGSRFSTSWGSQWRLKFQVGVYSHILYSLFPPEQVYGVKINGIFPTAEPRLKRDGQPYANSRDVEFHRVPVQMNLQAMDAWLTDANWWMDRIEEDLDALSYAQDGDQCLRCFHRNRESCTHYGQCPMLDWCSIWHNPLQHADAPPQGFTQKFWDPRSVEYSKALLKL
jgi:hypothetical protein